MHQHGPTDLTGPVRGTNAWWQGMGSPPDGVSPDGVSPEGTPTEAHYEEATTSTKSRKGKRMGRGKRGSNDGIRMEMVERVRKEIAAGTYDSQEKWEAALDRLLARLDSD